MTGPRVDSGETPASLGPSRVEAMQHIQQLTMTGLPERPARTTRRPEARAPELPDRESVRRMAKLHHKQLVKARERSGSDFEMLRAQTDALRKYTLQFTPEQADTFMNVYTEESSAIERAWMARQSGQRTYEPLSHTLIDTVVNAVMLVTLLTAIGLAIYYFV